jgi:uncharacterized protein (DUF983 family)
LSLIADIAFAFRPRCPVCRKGRLFQPRSATVVDTCADCGAALGTHDIGDGAAVFLIFLLGFTLVPLAWTLQRLVAPPLWVQGALWTVVMLGAIALLLPAVKAYIILLEFRHRRSQD